eukprot:TRINITY_DN34065_c0_g1_i1.p1 TRINITY_DN34065_c0_g1~~TRINITY_DN34065_c0_g1_i1.p1  ORF type:complete len:551 (+),score=140.01 TRINITY_DN34065_c0_g1_i1:162-1814(+)
MIVLALRWRLTLLVVLTTAVRFGDDIDAGDLQPESQLVADITDTEEAEQPTNDSVDLPENADSEQRGVASIDPADMPDVGSEDASSKGEHGDQNSSSDADLVGNETEKDNPSDPPELLPSGKDDDPKGLDIEDQKIVEDLQQTTTAKPPGKTMRPLLDRIAKHPDARKPSSPLGKYDGKRGTSRSEQLTALEKLRNLGKAGRATLGVVTAKPKSPEEDTVTARLEIAIEKLQQFRSNGTETDDDDDAASAAFDVVEEALPEGPRENCSADDARLKLALMPSSVLVGDSVMRGSPAEYFHAVRDLLQELSDYGCSSRALRSVLAAFERAAENLSKEPKAVATAPRVLVALREVANIRFFMKDVPGARQALRRVGEAFASLKRAGLGVAGCKVMDRPAVVDKENWRQVSRAIKTGQVVPKRASSSIALLQQIADFGCKSKNVKVLEAAFEALAHRAESSPTTADVAKSTQQNVEEGKVAIPATASVTVPHPPRPTKVKEIRPRTPPMSTTTTPYVFDALPGDDLEPSEKMEKPDKVPANQAVESKMHPVERP